MIILTAFTDNVQAGMSVLTAITAIIGVIKLLQRDKGRDSQINALVLMVKNMSEQLNEVKLQTRLLEESNSLEKTRIRATYLPWFFSHNFSGSGTNTIDISMVNKGQPCIFSHIEYQQGQGFFLTTINKKDQRINTDAYISLIFEDKTGDRGRDFSFKFFYKDFLNNVYFQEYIYKNPDVTITRPELNQS